MYFSNIYICDRLLITVVFFSIGDERQILYNTINYIDNICKKGKRINDQICINATHSFYDIFLKICKIQIFLLCFKLKYDIHVVNNSPITSPFLNTLFKKNSIIRTEQNRREVISNLYKVHHFKSHDIYTVYTYIYTQQQKEGYYIEFQHI